jgi:hypothetical protein
MLARTRIGFGGSPERIFVFVTPPIQRKWYDVQSFGTLNVGALLLSTPPER